MIFENLDFVQIFVKKSENLDLRYNFLVKIFEISRFSQKYQKYSISIKIFEKSRY